jgi:two-component system OmpR family sensor kinase
MAWSIRTRLLIALLGVAVASAAGLSAYFITELESFGLRKLEERLHAESLVISTFVSASYRAAGTETLSAAQSDALGSELARAAPDLVSRIRILDESGTALVDSAGEDGVGLSYAQSPEIISALVGEYGAATRITDDGRVALYVANPITLGDRVVGVAYTSSTTFSIRTLLRDYRTRLAIVIALFAAAALVLTEILARRLSRPLLHLAEGAAAFARGDHSVRVTPRGSHETRGVAEAFNAMADEVQTALAELKDEEQRKSRFVSDVSHELRTPLTAIRGAAETLLGGNVAEADARQFLTTIVRESERLARLASDLLALQRIEGATGELPMRLVDLASVVDRAIEGLQPLSDERGVTVTREGEAPEVLGDPDRLQQVVWNLVDNATRMTPRGKAVLVRVGTSGDSVTVAVLDEGQGIGEDALPHVFDRFFRAQASRDRGSGGAGLGLAIVSAIARAHAGSVSAANRPEGGSVFTLTLPALRR